MSIWTNSAEGGADGTAVTTANSASSGSKFSNVTAGSGTSITYSSSAKAHGSLGYMLTCATGSSTYFMTSVYATDGSGQFALRFYANFSSLPGSTFSVCSVYDNTNTPALQIALRSDGRIYVTGVSAVGTTASAISLNTWYRMEVQGTIGTTTTNSVVNFNYYALDSTTTIENINSSTANLGTTGVVSYVGLGKISPSATLAGNIMFDDIAFSTQTTTPIGPYTASNNPPTANAGANQVNLEPYSIITLSGTDADTDGTVVSRQWRQVSGSPSVTLSTASSAVATYTAPGTIAGTTLTFGYTVIDNGGASSQESTVTNTIYPVTERAVMGGVEVPVQTAVVNNGGLI